MKMYKIKKIEFTLFEVSIPNICSDQSGFGVWYEPRIQFSTETICNTNFY